MSTIENEIGQATEETISIYLESLGLTLDDARNAGVQIDNISVEISRGATYDTAYASVDGISNFNPFKIREDDLLENLLDAIESTNWSYTYELRDVASSNSSLVLVFQIAHWI